MAPPKKKGFSIKFDLSLGGLLGVGVVCFCIFLWMFLLGVWAGQTGLISGLSFPAATPAIVSGAAKVEAPKPAPAKETLPAPEPVPESTPTPAPEPAPTLAPEAPAPAVAAPAAAVEPPEPPNKKVAAEIAQAKAPEPPFYAIQVGAFRASENVEEELQLWRSRGYEAFARPPGEGERLTKVYIGHYPDAAGARQEAEVVRKKRKTSTLIVMIRPEPANRP